MKQGNGDPTLDAVRRRRHAERPRARRRIRAVRQFLRRRRRQLRRPRVLDRRLRDRRHPEDLADLLRRTAAGCISAKATAFMRNPFGNLDGAGARATSGTTRRARQRQRPQLRRVRAGNIVEVGRRRRRRRVESVPGLKNLVAPSFAGFDLDDHRSASASTTGCSEFKRLRPERQPAAAVDHPPRQRSHATGRRRARRRRAR